MIGRGTLPGLLLSSAFAGDGAIPISEPTTKGLAKWRRG